MKYRIVIRAFTLRRDLPQAYVLAKLLEDMGCETFIACTRNYQMALKYWRPHASVINTVGKINNTTDVSPDTKVIVWPAEGARAPHSSDAVWLKKLMPEGTAEKVSLYLLWGEYTRRAFLQYLDPEIDKKIVVCGHPKLDLIKFKPKIEASPGTIGFLTKFPGINFYNRKPSITPLIQNPENGTKILKLQIDQFVLMLKVIERLAGKGRYRMSIRPHPLEAPEEYELLRKKYPDLVEIDDGFDFADWAARQKVILTPASSSFIDLTLLNVPVISIDNILLKDHPVIEETQKKVVVTSLDGNSYKPQSLEEIVEMACSDLKPIPEGPEMDNYNRDVYDWPKQGSAIKRTAEAILSHLHGCRDLKNTMPILPKFALDICDRIQFHRARKLSGQYHENFNYREGFHKIPPYLDEIVRNILQDKEVRH